MSTIAEHTDKQPSLEAMQASEAAYRQRHGQGSTHTPITSAYAAKLAATQPNTLENILHRADRITARPQKQVRQLLGYDLAAKCVWPIMKATLAQRHKKMQVDDHNRPIIQNLIKWFIGDPTCAWPLDRGICLAGGVGSGKTFLMDTMQAFTLAAGLRDRHFRTARTIDVADAVRDHNGDQKTAGKAAQKLEHLNHGAWCFDDLGQEALTVKVYGDERAVMEPILTRRYTAFTQGNCITHATTNLTEEEIETTYGSRVADRFKEMFTYVFLDGPSRRA